MKSLIINSGGQSGVDRAALDAAVARRMDYSGWCPAGGWAEDLTDPPGLLARYPKMIETPKKEVEQRTEWNARDSDATLIFLPDNSFRNSPGTNYTVDMARKYQKPFLIIAVGATCQEERIFAFLDGVNQPHVKLNFAGPRESEAPGIYEKAKSLIGKVIDEISLEPGDT